MEKLHIVLEKLRSENYNASIKTEILCEKEWYQITWKDESGDECFISQDDIAIEGDKIAWFQSSKHDRHLLKVYENDISYSWVPETYNPIFGCICLLLEWYKDHLIFIYQEKHCIYICSYRDNRINHFHFHGEDIERKGNLISYENYMGRLTDKVRLIQLPELIELEPISKTEADKLGLIPSGLNRPGNFLSINFQGV
ncbi:hypothetical protein [Niastella sp. OAS944]|uniref:hypothetical protein n=1 Tax=Niastella sp. OAS944 TaxID=2664089 RepID=UPI00348D531B|nr:hypothetical protein [Chitinophagaceae bacterium OAS944]